MAFENKLSCPVCTEVFCDPVLLSCGHSFCRQCITDLRTFRSAVKCLVCQQVSFQSPVSNLCLKKACESYLREQNSRTESDEEHECPVHGEKIELFCQTDEMAICSTCKKREHGKHKVQPLQQAVRRRKGKLKEALRPAEKSLLSLLNATSQESKISKYIQSQSQMTERSIRMEFEKLHHFLSKEEQRRIAALNEEESEKGEKMERVIQERILLLSDKIREVEERMEDDDINFLKVDPVILNPSITQPDFSVSDDLTSVTSSLHKQNKPNAVPLHRKHMVLGSVGYGEHVYTWDIEVGNSRHWTLGVCLRSVERSVVQPLTPENGYWGLKRDGDSYKLLTTGNSKLNMKVNPQVVRVKLVYHYGIFQELKLWRKVIFSDARSDSFIAEFTRVPLENKLFPFLIPEDQSVPLRVAPAKVILTAERKLSLLEIHGDRFFICIGFILAIPILILFCLIYFNIKLICSKI
ncbi:Nuclear factor 7, ovary [Labeo rohita]|uniref:Nuclear factor 7, ovary n=1 Tax=Labeo rohita TaxID=84645 RepID=A0ABQ8LIE5_LABRO|nr:Nuclear factor 7, ovary [Labeo rohita]